MNTINNTIDARAGIKDSISPITPKDTSLFDLLAILIIGGIAMVATLLGIYLDNLAPPKNLWVKML